jgi:hypothetical protein
MKFRSQNGVISAMTAILSEILVQTLSGVFEHGLRDEVNALQMVGNKHQAISVS